MAGTEPTVIKKYANRRLYHTGTSTYVTLDDLARMVKDGEDFVVHDAKSGDDLTRNVLLQIIIEQESDHNPLFTTDNLQNFIRYYGAGHQQGFSEFMNQSVAFFKQQQEQAQKLGTSIPFLKDTLKCLLRPSCILLQDLLRW